MLTSDELRIAARQAITLALAIADSDARKDLLLRAQRLFDEAGSASSVNRDLSLTR
jgi:hypothetical protein